MLISYIREKYFPQILACPFILHVSDLQETLFLCSPVGQVTL